MSLGIHLTNIVNELKRRNVFKVSVAYLALGWLVVQVTSIAVPALNLPESLNGIVFYLGIIGFPFAIFFAWAYELTPDGVRKAQDNRQPIANDNAPAIDTSKHLNLITIGILSLAIIFLIVERFYFTEQPLSEVKANSEKLSIAVLPFANLSNHPENAFFAGGVHEDILTNLSEFSQFKVISRTSVMPYINSPLSLPGIAKELGAHFILEGSVRRIKDHVRITVQLIDAQDDNHMWANNYDRKIIDEFALQTAVSKEISETILFQLSPDGATNTQDMPTKSVQAYDLYIKAKNIERSKVKNEQNLTEQKTLLLEAVEHDPNFVQAWANLNEVCDEILRTIGQYGYFKSEEKSRTEIYDEYENLAKTALQKAMQISPENVETLIARASGVTGDEAPQTESDFNQRKIINDYALSIYPDNAKLHYVLAWWYIFNNERDKATPHFLKALEQDPFHAQIVEGSLFHFRSIGDQERVTQLFSRLKVIAPEKGKIAPLGKVSQSALLGNVYASFARTADESILKQFQPFLLAPAEKFDFGDITKRKHLLDYWVYSNNWENILTMQTIDLTDKIKASDFADAPNWNSLSEYSLINFMLMKAHEINQDTQQAKAFAKQLISIEQNESYQRNKRLTRARVHVALAHLLLEQNKEAQQTISEISDVEYGFLEEFSFPSLLILAKLDMNKATNLFIKFAEKEPNCYCFDVIAMNHISFRELLMQPEIKAFYQKQQKWLPYLEKRIPEYE